MHRLPSTTPQHGQSAANRNHDVEELGCAASRWILATPEVEQRDAMLQSMAERIVGADEQYGEPVSAEPVGEPDFVLGLKALRQENDGRHGLY